MKLRHIQKNFHRKRRKVTVEKKLEKIEFYQSHIEQCKQTQLYYSWSDLNKFNRYSIVIIFGTLGNLKGCWNIWTFGNLRFKILVTYSDSTCIHTKLYHSLTNYPTKKLSTRLRKIYSQARAVIEVLSDNLIKGITSSTIHIVEADSREFYRNNNKDYTAFEFLNQRHYRKFIPLEVSNNNSNKGINISRTYIFKTNSKSYKNHSRFYTTTNRGQINQRKRHRVIGVNQQHMRQTKITNMGRPDKSNAQVASGKKRPKIAILNKCTENDQEEIDSMSDDEAWKSTGSDHAMDVNDAADVLISFADVNTLSVDTQLQEDANSSDLYILAVKIYHYGMLTTQLPSQEFVHLTITELAPNQTHDLLQGRIIFQVIEPRKERETRRNVPEFLTLFEQWVMESIRDKSDSTYEAYATLGTVYKLAERYVTSHWADSSLADDTNVRMLLTLNITDEDTRETALAMLAECQRTQMEERNRSLAASGRSIFELLEGVAEETAKVPLPQDVDAVTELQKFITSHGKAVKKWVEVARGRHKVKTTTSDSVSQIRKDTRITLPPMAQGPITATRTLIEGTTEVEQNKIIRASRQQRGREHAVNPRITKPHWGSSSTEILAAKEAILDELTRFDDITFITRLVQIVGLPLPKVLDTDVALNSNITVKIKLRREIDTILKKAGHDSANDLNHSDHKPNQWTLDEDWFENNWSTLHNQGDATYQIDTIYIVLKTRIYFAPVGTFGTTQTNEQGIVIPYGNQGTGRCIFDMCQVITSDHDYTTGAKEYRYYKQYTVIGMPSTCKVEMLFHKKTGPVLSVFRGLYQEVEHQTSLAVQILAITQHILELGIPETDFGILIVHNWHGIRRFTTGVAQPIPRTHNDNFISKEKKEKFLRDKNFKLEKRTELIAKVCFCGDTRGHDSANTPMFKKYRDMMAQECKATGQYVNLKGLRMERFMTMEDMHENLTHSIDVDTPHVTVIDNIVDNVRARDVLEELLADNTQTNWHNVPNMTCCYIQPSCNVSWGKHGTQLICVWRHETAPKVMNVGEPTANEIALQQVYEQRTNHYLELQNVIAKYSSCKLGGVTSTMMDTDPRTRWVELGKLHKVKEINHNYNSSSESMTVAKKARLGGTPEKAVTRAQRTPMTNDTVSSSITKASSHLGSVERYEKPDSVILAHLAQLSKEMTKLTTDMEQMQAKTVDSELRQAATETSVQDLANKITLTQSKNLKKILRQVRAESDNLSDSNLKVDIYQKQLHTSTTSTVTEAAQIQATLEIAQLDAKRCARTLEDLREDARDQAELDGVVLTDQDLAYVD